MKRVRKIRKRKIAPFVSNGTGGRCHWCKRDLKATTDKSSMAATRDHVHPKSRGGELRVWACRACNNLKADMDEQEWLRFMRDNTDWWRLYGDKRGYRAALMKVPSYWEKKWQYAAFTLGWDELPESAQ